MNRASRKQQFRRLVTRRSTRRTDRHVEAQRLDMVEKVLEAQSQNAAKIHKLLQEALSQIQNLTVQNFHGPLDTRENPHLYSAAGHARGIHCEHGIPETISSRVQQTPSQDLSFDYENIIQNEDINTYASEDWKYWQSWVTDSLTSDVQLMGFFPNYAPSWELIPDNGQWFHVDDENKECPTLIKNNSLEGDATTLEQTLDHQYISVPYSFVPPSNEKRTQLLSTDAMLRAPKTSVDWDVTSNHVGHICAAPPDARVALAFERSEIRLMGEEVRQEFLGDLHEVLKSLLHSGGAFYIMDLDLSLKRQVYEYTANASLGTSGYIKPCFRGALPALQAESRGFTFPPTQIHRHYLPQGGPQKQMTYDQKSDKVPAVDVDYSDSHTSVVVDTYPRPWCRIICIENLANVWSEEADIQHVHRKLKCLVDLDEHGADHCRSRLILNMIDAHVLCQPYRLVCDPSSTFWRAFHVIWPKLGPANLQKSIWNPKWWSSGEFYFDPKFVMMEQAFTVGHLPHGDPDTHQGPVPAESPLGSYKYWTIIILSPSNLKQWKEIELQHRTLAIVEIIACVLAQAADSWDELSQHFNRRLERQMPIYEPGSHDSLLVDDTTYSRSRKYYWAINALSTFQDHIEDTIEEWNKFWRPRQEIMYRLWKEEHGCSKDCEPCCPEFKRVMNKVDSQLRRLQDQGDRYSLMRQNTLDLREGLLSASGVIESRESTRLAENVKLLTVASIFYLPLSFCVALWSISESSSTAALITTTIVVAVLTYIMVANLNNAMGALLWLYSKLRNKVLQHMRRHELVSWRHRAQAFNSLRPRNEPIEPSQWLFLRFVLLATMPMQWIRTAQEAYYRRRPDTSQQSNGNAAEMGMEC